MGSCVSVHKESPGSAMKLGVLRIPESPVKSQFVNGDHPVKTFHSHGSKEEIFFDSQPWLESDCEDDFFSVNGDFTPSRGNTPVHQKFTTGTPNRNKTPFDNKPPSPRPTLETSPTGKKKRLSELFRNSLGGEQDANNNLDITENKSTPNVKNIPAKPTILDVLPKSGSSTPYINSVSGSERTPNGDPLFERERSVKSKQCCLPSLMACRSFSDRKKKMSPAIAVNDEAQV